MFKGSSATRLVCNRTALVLPIVCNLEEKDTCIDSECERKAYDLLVYAN